jgi:hypothetical protein
MGVASTTVADSSRLLSTLQKSSSHDAESSLYRFYEPHFMVSHNSACAFSCVLDIYTFFQVRACFRLRRDLLPARCLHRTATGLPASCRFHAFSLNLLCTR